MNTYQETVEWMFQQLPMYQRVGKTAFKKDLTNTINLASALGDPHKKFKSIHVAGTNGKGSTSHMLAAVLQEAGYKVGLYTSPHLKDFRERIRINGVVISEEAVVDFIEKNRKFLEENKLSFFEMTVGMAFDYFASEEVDVAVVEVGMGGRLDSTNIITPEVSVITNIGFDHTAFLGNTYAEIASEKAGIIKPGIPVVIGEKQPETEKVFIEAAERNNSPIRFAQEIDIPVYNTDLKGDYQKKNIKTVFSALNVMKDRGWKIEEEHIKNGLSSVKLHTGLHGRWDVLREKPKVICDTAHNKEGLELVLEQLKKEKFNSLHIILGTVNDKDLKSIIPLFPVEAHYYFCKPEVPRGLDAAQLKEAAADNGLEGRAYASVADAYEDALQNALDEDLIFIGGSNFVVAEIL